MSKAFAMNGVQNKEQRRESRIRKNKEKFQADVLCAANALML
jgi:hypothetical protein